MRIVQHGNNPNCVHNEFIDVNNRGVCKHCGQVKDYSREPDAPFYRSPKNKREEMKE